MHYPTDEFSHDEAARGVRLSGAHPEAAAAGAVFGSVGWCGFERPLHFQPNGSSSGDTSPVIGGQFHTPERHSFNARDTSWWSAVAAEHFAVRHGVALFDLSSFGKLMVTGSGAEAAMEWCASSGMGPQADWRVTCVAAALIGG